MNKKGFTLVELLAVIVILAVIMLVAVTAIGPVIERANKGAYASSAQIILSGAENAYVADQMAAPTKRKLTGTKCVSIKALEDAGYFDPKGKSYVGSVLINATNPNKVTYKIWLADWSSNYIIAGKESKDVGVDTVEADSSLKTANYTNTFTTLNTDGTLNITNNEANKKLIGMFCGSTGYLTKTIGKLNA